MSSVGPCTACISCGASTLLTASGYCRLCLYRRVVSKRPSTSAQKPISVTKRAKPPKPKRQVDLNARTRVCQSCTLEKDREEFGVFPERCRKCVNAYQMRRNANNPRQYLYESAKFRAKAKGLEFSIRRNDIRIPEFCPIFGTKLEVGSGPNAPSLDRVDNAKGYTSENIRVISRRANMLKKDADLDTLKRLVAYIEDHEKQSH